MRARWRKIVGLWLAGVLAAAQLSKMAVLAPVLRDRFALTLPQTGLLISLLEVGGALLGLVVGITASRLPLVRTLGAGLVVLALASALEAFSPNVAFLFTARSIEGIGYLLVVVSAPTLIVAVAGDRDRVAALALWSTFVPVGMAFGSIVTGMIASVAGMTGACLAWTVACAFAMTTLTDIRVTASNSSGGPTMPSLGAWLSTSAFGFYTAAVSTLIALLPLFLIEQANMPMTSASLAAGLATITAVLGAGSATALSGGGRLDRARAIAILAAALLPMAATAPHLFAVTGAESGVVTAAIAAAVMILGGIASPIVFARLPAIAGALAGGSRSVAATNGLITQFGAAGALIGPPVGAYVVKVWGWGSLGIAISALVLVMLALSLIAEAFYGGVASGPIPSDGLRDDWGGDRKPSEMETVT